MSEGKWNPPPRRVEEHRADTGCKEREDSSRVVPFRTEHKMGEILTRQSKEPAQTHADKSKDRKRVQKISFPPLRIIRQSAKRRNSRSRDWIQDLAGREIKQIKCSFVKSQCYGAEMPTH